MVKYGAKNQHCCSPLYNGEHRQHYGILQLSTLTTNKITIRGRDTTIIVGKQLLFTIQLIKSDLNMAAGFKTINIIMLNFILNKNSTKGDGKYIHIY